MFIQSNALQNEYVPPLIPPVATALAAFAPEEPLHSS